MRTFLLLLAASSALAASASAQTPAFTPFPNGSERAYQFDLARNFFPSPEAAALQRSTLIARLKRLHGEARHIASAAALHHTLSTADSLAKLLGRQYAYLSLRNALDTRDGDSRRALSDLSATAEPLFSEIQRAVLDLSPARFATYAHTEPRLRTYEYSITVIRRDVAHTLDPSAERALAAVEAEATAWGPALFQSTLAGTRWGTVRAPDGDLDVRRQGNQIRNHTNRAVRESGFRLGQGGIESRRDVYAFILTRAAASRTAIARQRRWPDYPTQMYAAGGLRPSDVRALLTSLAARADVNKRYERSRIADIQRGLGIDTVHVWDLTAPAPGSIAPRFTIEEASREVVAAAQPLGADYVRELRALLDPRNGRLDLVPRANRVDRAGFSTGSVGYPSMFFEGRFEGYAEDVIILAHEAGHAVQNMLMDSAGVLPRYAGGPNYFTESFATLSELLLLEHLYRSASSPVAREYYRNRLIANALEVFKTGHESLTELQLYDSVAAGRLLGPDDIESLTQDVGSRFSVWFGPGSERQFAWVQPLQFYTWPLYRVNYVIAKLLALQYLGKLQADPEAFRKQYGAMLSNGYDAEPRALLQRFLGVSLTEPDALVDGALRVVGEWMRDAPR